MKRNKKFGKIIAISAMLLLTMLVVAEMSVAVGLQKRAMKQPALAVQGENNVDPRGENPKVLVLDTTSAMEFKPFENFQGTWGLEGDPDPYGELTGSFAKTASITVAVKRSSPDQVLGPWLLGLKGNYGPDDIRFLLKLYEDQTLTGTVTYLGVTDGIIGTYTLEAGTFTSTWEWNSGTYWITGTLIL